MVGAVVLYGSSAGRALDESGVVMFILAITRELRAQRARGEIYGGILIKQITASDFIHSDIDLLAKV